MKRLITLLILPIVFFAGCTGQQVTNTLADVNDAVRIQRIVNETVTQLEAVKADTTKSDTEKIIATADIVTAKAVETGLISEGTESPFLTGLKMALDAYITYQPLGAAKMNWTMLVILAYLAWKRSQKK